MVIINGFFFSMRALECRRVSEMHGESLRQIEWTGKRLECKIRLFKLPIK